MADALEAGYDLGALALCFLAIGLLLAAKGMVAAVARVFNVSILGTHPFGFISNALENAVIGALDDAIKGVEKATARFESGLIDSFGMLIALPALAILGTKAALQYLWNEALRPTIHSITDPIRTTATRALNRVDDLTDTVAQNLASAEAYARARASSALESARSYADGRVDAIARTLRGDIAAAISTAERYADEAVGRLRAAEDAAIANAVGLAAAARAAGEAAAAAALATAEHDIAAGVATAEAAAAGALAASDAAGKAALDVVRSVAVTAEQDIETVLGELDARTVAALIASIPALATIVNAIATEAGLENAACRTKVKGICGTDPTSWGNLLAGLAAIGLAFNLRELNAVAKPLIGGLSTIIREAA